MPPRALAPAERGGNSCREKRREAGQISVREIPAEFRPLPLTKPSPVRLSRASTPYEAIPLYRRSSCPSTHESRYRGLVSGASLLALSFAYPHCSSAKARQPPRRASFGIGSETSLDPGLLRGAPLDAPQRFVIEYPGCGTEFDSKLDLWLLTITGPRPDMPAHSTSRRSIAKHLQTPRVAARMGGPRHALRETFRYVLSRIGGATTDDLNPAHSRLSSSRSTGASSTGPDRGALRRTGSRKRTLRQAQPEY